MRWTLGSSEPNWYVWGHKPRTRARTRGADFRPKSQFHASPIQVSKLGLTACDCELTTIHIMNISNTKGPLLSQLFYYIPRVNNSSTGYYYWCAAAVRPSGRLRGYGLIQAPQFLARPLNSSEDLGRLGKLPTSLSTISFCICEIGESMVPPSKDSSEADMKYAMRVASTEPGT